MLLGCSKIFQDILIIQKKKKKFPISKLKST